MHASRRCTLGLRRGAIASARARPLLARPFARLISSSGPPSDPDEAIAHNLQTHEMPRVMQRRVAGLDTLQNQVEALEQAHERRLRELELAFHEDTQGILERRRTIVTGEDEPSDEEVRASSISLDVDASDSAGKSCPPGIPGFWMTAMMQCDALQDPDRPVFNDNDWLVLQHVEDVRAEPWTPPAPAFDDGLHDEDGNPAFPDDDDDDDEVMADDDDDRGHGFAVHFTFAKDNPFIDADARELSVYCYSHGEVALVAPDVIPWRGGMDPTTQTRKKKKRNKRTGQTVERTVHEKVPSFFNIFTQFDHDNPEELGGGGGGGAGDGAQMGEELMEATVEQQERICLAIRENLVPHATAYYIQDLIDDGNGDGDGDFDGSDDLPVRR